MAHRAVTNGTLFCAEELGKSAGKLLKAAWIWKTSLGMCHKTQLLSSAPAASGTAEVLAQSSEGQLWPSRNLGLQAAPGAPPWARAGEEGVLACRGVCGGSEPALPTGEGKQNEWCQRMWKRLTGSSQ